MASAVPPPAPPLHPAPPPPPRPGSDSKPEFKKRATVVDVFMTPGLVLEDDDEQCPLKMAFVGTRKLNPCDHLSIAVAVLIPAVIILFLFTNVFGNGLKTYAMLLKMNSMGTLLVMGGLLILFIAYLCDYSQWKKTPKNIMLGLVSYLCLFGGVLKVRSYPEAPYIVILFHVPIFLGIVRQTCTKAAFRRDVYNAIAFWCGFFSIAVLILWLVYVTGGKDWQSEKARMISEGDDMYKAVDYHPYEIHCGANATKVDTEGKELDETALTKRSTACKKVAGSQYLCWVGPMAVTIALFLIGLLCRLRAKFLCPKEGASQAESATKMAIGMLCVLVLLMWVSASVAGADMGLSGTIQGFVGGFSIATFVWIYAELGEENILQQAAQSKLVQQCLGIARSDWARALFILCFNVIIPLAFPVNILNQCVRKCRRKTEYKGLFTENFANKWAMIKLWNWTSILSKVHLLAILYFVLMIGVAKITYIFLSWLNQKLQTVDFGLVMMIFFGIGFIMFMLPPVPGVPVYITGGIILASRAASGTAFGFWGGTGLAILLGYTLKLTAVAGQWSIGVGLGKNVGIQKMVGVDQVGIRAIEDILRKPGLSLPKVAVLVGGPDWPTSVLCGILRIKVGQAVLGTMPCILVATPCVLAGAFLLKAGDPAEGGSWGAIAGATLMVASLGQAGAGLMAAYFMSQVVSAKGEELAKPRPEHRPIEELTRKEQAAVDAYKEATQWQVIPGWVQWTLIISTFMQVMSWALLVFQDKSCFRPFSLTSRVEDPYEKNGLNGAVINIVLPMGYMALGMFVVACLGYKIVTTWAKGAAKRKLASKPPQVELAEDTDPPTGFVGANPPQQVPPDTKKTNTVPPAMRCSLLQTQNTAMPPAMPAMPAQPTPAMPPAMPPQAQQAPLASAPQQVAFLDQPVAEPTETEMNATLGALGGSTMPALEAATLGRASQQMSTSDQLGATPSLAKPTPSLARSKSNLKGKGKGKGGSPKGKAKPKSRPSAAS